MILQPTLNMEQTFQPAYSVSPQSLLPHEAQGVLGILISSDQAGQSLCYHVLIEVPPEYGSGSRIIYFRAYCDLTYLPKSKSP